MERRRASDASRIQRWADNPYLALLARTMAAVTGMFAVPFLIWITSSTYQNTADVQIIKNDLQNIRGSIADPYRAADAARDFATRDRRIAEIRQDVKDTNIRIDLLQQAKR